MTTKDKSKCRTHTYLNEGEERSLASAILKELPSEHRYDQPPKPVPAPSGLCDLIY